MQKENNRFYLPLWLLWGVALLCVSGGLGCFPLLDNNEGLYAEIPREMLASGDWKAWVIPHLNGLVYMEKPPLLYWLTAMFFFLFGESSWTARLTPALAALFCFGQLIWFGNKIQKPQAGRFSALIFISCIGVIAMSRLLMFDMLLTALLTAALMRMYLFMRAQGKSYLRSGLAFLALAILAKGFVALILFVAVAACLAVLLSTSVADLWQRCVVWLDWRAWLLFLVILTPWHVLACMVEPAFAWFYFVNEHILRFLGKREPHDYYVGAWWYYLPRVLVFLFPWSFLIPSLLFTRARLADDRGLHGFLLFSWLIPLGFFSLSSAKANYYLVTVIPLASLQLALFWENRKISRWMQSLPWLLLTAGTASLAYFLGRSELRDVVGITVFSYPSQRYLTVVQVVLSLLSLLCLLLCLVRPRILAVCFVGISFLFTMSVLPVVRAMTPLISTKLMAVEVQNKHADAIVFLYKAFEEQSTLPFYLKKPVYILQSRSSDLYWGNRLHQNEIFWDDQEFSELVLQKPVVILVLAKDESDFLSKPYASCFKRQTQIGNTIKFTSL